MHRVVLACFCLVAVPSIALAVFGIADVSIVSDPQGLIQQVAQVGEQVTTNAKLVDQYQQLLLSYAQDAKAYVALPQTMVDQITSLSQTYLDLLQQGQSLGYTMGSITTQFDTLYKKGAWSGNVLTTATSLLQPIREASRMATQLSALYTTLCQEMGNKQQQMQMSRAAIGPLSAQQATNELLGTVIDQQTTMQALTATANRMHMAGYMQQVVEDEAVADKASQWLEGWSQPRKTDKVTLPE